jgi:predicted Holliday junction resolvase-like endonuclease
MALTVVILSVVITVLVVVAAVTLRVASALRGELRATRSSRQSQSTRYGQITEQFMPWASSYPYDPSGFRFLGSPIDGVQFEEDQVILMEFKTADSKLSSTQRRIRDLVRKGKVSFEEFRLS